jgi:hypothetical protein
VNAIPVSGPACTQGSDPQDSIYGYGHIDLTWLTFAGTREARCTDLWVPGFDKRICVLHNLLEALDLDSLAPGLQDAAGGMTCSASWC